MLFLDDMKCLSSRERNNINPHAEDTAHESIFVYKQGRGCMELKCMHTRFSEEYVLYMYIYSKFKRHLNTCRIVNFYKEDTL